MNSPDSSGHLNSNLGVSTAPVSEWFDPYQYPPPHGKILLLTWDNIQTEGSWGEDGHLQYAAWAHKPARQDWLKARMWAKYIGQFVPTKIPR